MNATGTGADKIRSMANPALASRMRPSKGVHLLFPAETFPGSDALLVPHTEDGRVIFAVPWQERLLVGTTDDEGNAGDSDGGGENRSRLSLAAAESISWTPAHAVNKPLVEWPGCGHWWPRTDEGKPVS